MLTNYLVLQRTTTDFAEELPKERPTIHRLLRNQIFDLIKKHILGDMSIDRITLEVDGKKAEFYGKDFINQELQTVLRSMKYAKSVDFTAEYYYEGYMTSSDDMDPRLLADYLCQADESILEMVQHSFYIKDDSLGGDDDSRLYHYGLRDGEVFKGEVDLVMADQLPDTFDYHTYDMVLILDEFKVPQESMPKVKSYLSELTKLSHFDHYDIKGDEVNFSMNNANLRNKEGVDRFIYYTASLHQELQACKDQEGVLASMANFVDMSQGVPSKLLIDFDNEGNYSISIASI
ncbi:MAG: hypothetical protein GXZ13_07895 [Synergistaceae bacterium]|nr:hypothetical protein [Synergistaceae bacterium]